MVFKEYNKNGVVYSAAPNISAKHAFSSRSGGVSRGIYESLNLCFSCGDETESVAENYRIFAAGKQRGNFKGNYGSYSR